jgi:hypothetical protein
VYGLQILFAQRAPVLGGLAETIVFLGYEPAIPDVRCRLHSSLGSMALNR